MDKYVEYIECIRFEGNESSKSVIPVPKEKDIKIFVNGNELVSILCTPYKIKNLVIGFLYSEGILSGLDDIASFEFKQDDSVADIKLKKEFKKPLKKTLTSGFGKGTMFRTYGQKVDEGGIISPVKIHSLVKCFENKMELYKISGAVHATALGDSDNIILVAEDIGRHNTFDKIQGECLMKGIDTKGKIILTTGRISSEMLLKASRMGISIAGSMKSPTGNSVLLAKELGITLIGHANGSKFAVYTHEYRFSVN